MRDHSGHCAVVNPKRIVVPAENRAAIDRLPVAEPKRSESQPNAILPTTPPTCITANIAPAKLKEKPSLSTR